MLFLRRLKMIFRLRRLAKLIDLAKRTDELLIGSQLDAETRQQLQRQRDRLEETIHQLMTA